VKAILKWPLFLLIVGCGGAQGLSDSTLISNSDGSQKRCELAKDAAALEAQGTPVLFTHEISFLEAENPVGRVRQQVYIGPFGVMSAVISLPGADSVPVVVQWTYARSRNSDAEYSGRSSTIRDFPKTWTKRKASEPFPGSDIWKALEMLCLENPSSIEYPQLSTFGEAIDSIEAHIKSDLYPKFEN
jgi:hypothetical protein